MEIVLSRNAPVTTCVGHMVPKRQGEHHKEQGCENGLELSARKIQPSDRPKVEEHKGSGCSRTPRFKKNARTPKPAIIEVPVHHAERSASGAPDP
jgi:hypothetical protein